MTVLAKQVGDGSSNCTGSENNYSHGIQALAAVIKRNATPRIAAGRRKRASPGGQSFALRVQHAIVDKQVIEDSPANDGFFNNPGHIANRNVAIPDALRIDHHHRAAFALVEAASFVRADQRRQSAAFNFSLQTVAQFASTV